MTTVVIIVLCFLLFWAAFDDGDRPTNEQWEDE